MAVTFNVRARNTPTRVGKTYDRWNVGVDLVETPPLAWGRLLALGDRVD